MALIAKTRPQAALVLADGTVFQGESTGAAGLTVGEVVFNTSMTGNPHGSLLHGPARDAYLRAHRQCRR